MLLMAAQHLWAKWNGYREEKAKLGGKSRSNFTLGGGAAPVAITGSSPWAHLSECMGHNRISQVFTFFGEEEALGRNTKETPSCVVFVSKGPLSFA